MVTGVLVEQAADTVRILSTDDGRTSAVPRRSISELDVDAGRAGSPVAGALVGALGGGLLGAAIGSIHFCLNLFGEGTSNDCPGPPPSEVQAAALTGAASGAVIGMLIGALIRHDTWRPARAPALSVLPTVGRGRIGVAVSVR